jgi:predicted DNA-binding antitoxin AbrB/MazE fold protein
MLYFYAPSPNNKPESFLAPCKLAGRLLKEGQIMTMTIEAIYEQGVLRLKEPVSLEEGAHVEVIVITREPASGKATAAEILTEIAALPLEGDGEEFSGRDHDQILYGKG